MHALTEVLRHFLIEIDGLVYESIATAGIGSHADQVPILLIHRIQFTKFPRILQMIVSHDTRHRAADRRLYVDSRIMAAFA